MLGVDTGGNLIVHPAIKAVAKKFNDVLSAIITKHLKPSDINSIAFMGIRRPEPWIFFGMRKGADGKFTKIENPSI